MSNLVVENFDFQFDSLTPANVSERRMHDEAAAIFEVFLLREAEFGVHPSIVIHYPGIADRSSDGFKGNAANYVATQADALAADERLLNRTVVLTTFGDLVGPSLVAGLYVLKGRRRILLRPRREVSGS